jgi:hypothetical protein
VPLWVRVKAEGWFVDPFGAHEARWFSGGWPTALIRDSGVESHEDPPGTTYVGHLTPADEESSVGPDDLRRAGTEDEAYDPSTGVRAVWEWFLREKP